MCCSKKNNLFGSWKCQIDFVLCISSVQQTAQGRDIYFRVSIQIQIYCSCFHWRCTEVVHSGHCEHLDMSVYRKFKTWAVIVPLISCIHWRCSWPSEALKPVDTKGDCILNQFSFLQPQYGQQRFPLKGKAQHAFPIFGGKAMDEGWICYSRFTHSSRKHFVYTCIYFAWTFGPLHAHIGLVIHTVLTLNTYNRHIEIYTVQHTEPISYTLV